MIKLQEGQFVKLTGTTVKGENDIYVVDRDYTQPDKRWTRVCNEYLFNKVKLDGTKKEGGYDLYFYNENSAKNDPNMKIEIVTDLKKAKKEVNEYLKSLNDNEIIVTYVRVENQEIQKGSIIRFVKGLKFGTFGEKYIGTKSYWKVNFNSSNGLYIKRLGKKGQELSLLTDGNSYSFTKNLTDIAINEYIEVVEKIETRKGDIVKETVKTETITENKKEVTTENTTSNIEFEVLEDINEKTGAKIFVAKLIKTYSKDEWNQIYTKIKSLGGWYYKLKGFIFSENPTELLKENFSQSESAEEKNISNDEIKVDEEIINNKEDEYAENKNVACNVGFKDAETITINIEKDINFDNLENLFDNITIENDKRLSDEDNTKMEFFQKILDDMREKFSLYLNFYKENRINKIDYDGTIKEISGIGSYKNLEYEFVDKLVFREIKHLIERVYSYFTKKYDVKLETLTHDTDYYEGRPQKMKENFNWFMNVSINDLLDDIFNQLGGMSFNNKGLKEATDKLLENCKSWRDEDKTIVKNNKVTINNFIYYDSWRKSYGEYRNSDEEKINNLFKIISYVDTKELKNNYESVTKQINNYNNKYIGEYEINDNILKSFKTFKNGKVELKFNSGLQALNFAIKYLGYQE